jgi:hypothetical protein
VRTLLAGLRGIRRTPFALLPLVVEAAAASALLLVGAFPRTGASAAAAAAFPLDVYFDLKQALAHATGWLPFAGAVLLSIGVRSAALASTLWLHDGRSGSFTAAWGRAAKLTGVAAAALFPAAGLFYTVVATRYAPFAWIAAVAGFVPAFLVTRRAMRLDVSGQDLLGKGVPEAPGYLAYAYAVATIATVMTVLSRLGTWAPALLILLVAPLHALFVVGWREHVRAATHPGGGTIPFVATGLALLAFFGVSYYDRNLADRPPVGRRSANGTLLVLGGAGSTSTTGALSDFDPRDLGFARGASTLLSYGRGGRAYTAADTRRDLSELAEIVAEQIAEADPPRALVGHSQASLVLDRLLARGLTAPEASVQLAGSPVYPPPVEVSPPGQSGAGRPGSDFARAFSWVFDHLGFSPLHLDSPAAPTNLETVAVRSGPPRLAVWALGDSVWLDGDWRRPGEVNVVGLTDHVGVTNNSRALAIARDFLAGTAVSDDEGSWRGALASLVRYAFEPWRPK